MKASFFLLSTITTAAFARRTAYTTLSDDDQAQIKMQLTKWKTLYGELANTHGYVPASSTESVGLVDTHSAEELARFHNTLQDVVEAQKNNPNAEFSPFNMFALLTQAEFDKVLKNSFAGQNFNASTPVASTEDATTVASAVDWSTDKCNPPVRNQGQCGSCWAFSTIGAAEFANCLGTGTLLDLSEQQVTSCETQSMGCNGGYPTTAIDFESQGVCLEADYPYKAGTSGQTGSCQTSCTKQKLALGKTIQASGESALISALNTQPVVVTVASGNSVWRNYKGGVVTQCPTARSDHAVLAVGYGTSDKGDYFKIKNSWGAQWGDNGYIYLQRGVASPGMCNVVENIAYPQITGSSAPKPPSPSSSAPSPTSSQPTSVPTPDPTRRTKKPTSAPLPSSSTSSPTFAPTTETPTTVSPGDDETPSPTDSTPATTEPSDPSTPSPSDYTPSPSQPPSPTIRTRRPRPTNKPRPTWTWRPWPLKTKTPTLPPRDLSTPSPTDFMTPDTPSPADLTPVTTSPGDFTPSTPSPDDEYTPSPTDFSPFTPSPDDEYTPSPTDFSPSTPTPSDFTPSPSDSNDLTPSPSDFTMSPSEVPSTPPVPATTKKHKCKTRKPRTRNPRTRAPCTMTPSPTTLSPDTPAPFTTLPDTESPETPAPFTTLPDTDSPETTAPFTTESPDTASPVTEYPETTVPLTTSLPETESPTPATNAPTSRPTRKPRSPRPTGTLSPTVAPTAYPTPSSTTSSPAPAPGPSSSGMQGQLVDQTNKIRAAHGLGPVTWDADLAAKMQAYADSCPGFNHGGPEGWQNLATNQACSGDACLKIVGAAWLWYNQEETKWNYDAHQCNGDWSTCGHFSNMMSPGVTQIACGWSQCSNGNYVWCNYESSEMNPTVPRISGMTKEQLKATLTA